MLRERQKSILEASILEHIRTARPVASREIMGKFRFPISTATIRNEMLALDEEGYLEQPHTSAGRVPTDKGYRFFVDNSIRRMHLAENEEESLAAAFSLEEVEEFVKELSKTLARITGTFSAVGSFAGDIFYGSGFSEILEEPEFQDKNTIQSFGRLADILDETMPVFFEDDNTIESQVFIGKENPVPEARLYSMIVSRWKHPQGFEGFFTLIGPKRTNYRKHFAVMQCVKEMQ